MDRSGNDPKLWAASAWGMLPDAIVRNRELAPQALVLLAYRVTKGDWGLHWKDVGKRIKGINKANFYVALAILVQAGLIEREPYIQAREGRGRSHARDYLTARAQAGYRGSRRVEGRWFVERRFSVTEIAMLLYIRSCGPRGATQRQISNRFGWCTQTIQRAAYGLALAGEVIRSINGRTIHYVANKDHKAIDTDEMLTDEVVW
jgi:hypothetical protein